MPSQDQNTAAKSMRSYIQRVATGPELSKNIDRSEAADGMRQILGDIADPVQAGIFLIGLRMKRETADEEAGVLDALLENVNQCSVGVDDLVDIADPYDGFVRGTPASSFLPPVLASLGVPAVATGAYAVGPKYGVTHHMILKETGVQVLNSPEQVAAGLEDPAIGWGYIDQASFSPALHKVLDLRTRIVKRTVLTTLDVLLHPLKANRTHLMTGYVHKPYPPRYVRLAKQAGYASAMVIRGVEGGVVPSLSQPSRYSRFDSGTEYEELRLDPAELGIQQSLRIEDLPADAEHREVEGQPFASINADAVARHAARLGIAALEGSSGAVYDSLVYGAAIVLSHLGRASSLEEGAAKAREAIDSGESLKRFKALAG